MPHQAVTEPPFSLGIIGCGQPLRDFLGFLGQPGMAEVFAEVRFAGIVIERDEPDLLALAASLGFEAHASAAALAGSGPDLILYLSPDGRPEGLPPEVETLSGRAAAFIEKVVTKAALCETCRLDLSQARLVLSTIIDRLDDELALLGVDGAVLDVNKAVAVRLGRPKEALVGLMAGDVLPDFPDPHRTEADNPPILQLLCAGRKVERETSSLDAQSRLKYFRTSLFPVMGADERLDHILVMRRDITADVFLERRLQKSERLAAIGELSMFISHEIRNPLFAIAGFANSLLRSKVLDEPARDKVSIILKESNRLDDILKSIINFARPTEAPSGEVDLGAMVRQTLDLMRLGFEKQGVTVNLVLPPDLPKAKGNAETLKQCLLNLLRNALEAMPEGGALTVGVATRQGDLALSVADTGRGIPPENLPKVFNPFFSTKDKGSGLGLAMTKKILDELGGAVEIASELGHGATVTLVIPPFLALAAREAN